MESQAIVIAVPDRQPAAPVAHAWRDRSLLALLVLVAFLLHVWLMTHTEVASRDSIGFIRYAWQLDSRPWSAVLNESEQHPGYPLLILAASHVTRAVLSGPLSTVMQQTAQLVSVLAGVLVVLPTFYLGRELFDRRVGFWACLLFQCLPAAARVLADGLSEGTFLLFAATSLWLALRAFRTGSPGSFLLAGFASGLAYLTRPEGALIAALAGVVLLARQAAVLQRRPWRETIRSGILMALGLGVIAGPFVAVTGRLTTKPTGSRVMQEMRQRIEQSGPQSAAPIPESRQAGMGQVPLAVWWMEAQKRPGSNQDQRIWGLKALGNELMKGFFYIGWVPVLLGLWWHRERMRAMPGIWLLLLLCLVLVFLLYRVAAIMGYISDRHALLIVFIGSYWMAAGLLELPRRTAALVGRVPRPLLALALPLCFAGACLPKDLQPLHDDRAGFRAVGLWIAEHAEAVDPVVDPYCWAHYYAGRVFTERQPTYPSPGHVVVQYVVWEESNNPHPHLTEVARADRLRQQGKLVHVWSGKRYGKETARVCVYEVPAECQ